MRKDLNCTSRPSKIYQRIGIQNSIPIINYYSIPIVNYYSTPIITIL